MPQIREQEFTPNHFDITLNENILNDENLFMANTVNNSVKKHKKPDADFYRALSAEEFRERLIVIIDNIDKKYAKKCK